MTLKYANTQAFSGSRDNYMVSKWYKAIKQDSLKPGTLYNLPNPTNLRTGVVLQRESNINHNYINVKF